MKIVVRVMSLLLLFTFALVNETLAQRRKSSKMIFVKQETIIANIDSIVDNYWLDSSLDAKNMFDLTNKNVNEYIKSLRCSIEKEKLCKYYLDRFNVAVNNNDSRTAIKNGYVYIVLNGKNKLDYIYTIMAKAYASDADRVGTEFIVSLFKKFSDNEDGIYDSVIDVLMMENHDFGIKHISDVNGMVATKDGARSLFASNKSRKIIGSAYGEFPYSLVPIKTLPKVPSSPMGKCVWNSLEASLGDKEFRLLVYRLKNMNGGFAPVPVEERNGKYIFQGNDEYHFFAVTNDGRTVHGLVLEEKKWDDTEVLNKIAKGEKPFTFEFTSNVLGISSKNLKKMEYKNLKELIPRLKIKMACDYFDNSSTLDYHYARINSNLSPELDVSVTAGGKMDASIKANIDPTVFSLQENNNKAMINKKEGNEEIFENIVSADIGYKAISAKMGGKISKVSKISDRYMLIEIEFNVEGGVGLTPSSIAHYGFYVKPSRKVIVTDISDVTKDLTNYKTRTNERIY